MRTLLANLSEQSLVITVNRRLSTYLRSNYDQYQLSSGKTCWQNPNILPLGSWLTQMWGKQNSIEKQILNDSQELAIWTQIIQSTSDHYPLLQVDETAALAKQAWQLLQYWSLSLEELRKHTYNLQVSQFINWASQFNTICLNNNWLSNAELISQVILLLQKKLVLLPREVLMIGFDELPPVTQNLLEILRETSEVRLISTINENNEGSNDCFRMSLTDSAMEIRTAARFAKQMLEQYPHKKFGCIVLDLASRYTEVNQIFRETFDIAAKLPGHASGQLPYNISAGQTLKQFPIIQIALHSLNLLWGKLSLKTIGHLLQSPYLCHRESDVSFGALVDLELRQTVQQEPTLEILIPIITRVEKKNSSHSSWLSRWQSFILSIANLDLEINQLPSTWAKYFSARLHDLGWPGGRILNSLEYQVVQRWQQLLFEMSGLDGITGPIPLAAAIHQITLLCNNTTFQAQSDQETPIQVLGLLESIGYQFDILWITGLHDEAWPPKPKPNPFLPYSLQSQHHMPHASANRELAYSEKIIKRLLDSAQQVFVSSPSQQEDKLLRPSRLIQTLKIIEPTTLLLPLEANGSEIIYQHSEIEQITDTHANSISNQERIQGGSYIITQQAACPFKAFANVRLRADPLPDYQYGISPILRGTLVHRVLQQVWLNLQNQQTLQHLSSADLQQLLQQCIDKIIDSSFKPEDQAALQHLLFIEKKCLLVLISAWLEFEKQRPTFKVIKQETQHHMQLGPLNLTLQIDRIDEIEDESYLMIDYKTGINHSYLHWFGERPQQPQLPLYYSAINDKKISALAFAQVRGGAFAFKGIQDENSLSILPGLTLISKLKDLDIPNEWQQLAAYWQTNLQKLAEEFWQGNATVAPIDPTTCQMCHLQALCRIKKL